MPESVQGDLLAAAKTRVTREQADVDALLSVCDPGTCRNAALLAQAYVVAFGAGIGTTRAFSSALGMPYPRFYCALAAGIAAGSFGSRTPAASNSWSLASTSATSLAR